MPANEILCSFNKIYIVFIFYQPQCGDMDFISPTL